MKTHIELLKQLVSIPSAYPGEMAIQEYIAGMLLTRGFEVKVQHVEGGRANIIADKGQGRRVVLLYSHLDTVAPAFGWEGDPYNLRVKGDRLYGLGAFDMKGGMAVNIDTFLSFEPKHSKLRLLFCVDEENISRGGHIFAGSDLMKDIACVLSPEPAFAHGVNGIVAGRIGRAVIVVRLRRPSEHFYYYEPEHDINLAAAEIVLALKRIYHEHNGKKEFVFVRAMQSQSTGMSTPEEIVIELDTSILAPHTPEVMLQRVRETVQEAIGSRTDVVTAVSFANRDTPFLAGYELDPHNPYLKTMEKAIRQVTRHEAVPYFRTSVADDNLFAAAGKPVLGVGPAGGNAHGAQEWVSLSSLVKLREIYLQFLRHVDSDA